MDVANGFAWTIPGRMAKTMRHHRASAPSGEPDVVTWSADDEADFDLDVRAAYVHALNAAAREPIDVEPVAVSSTEGVVADAAARIKSRDYRANPGARCRRCEVRTICRSASA
jgi:hypothetical protein